MARNLSKWLRREAPPRVIYDNPPLTLVVCQIRFPRKIKAHTLEVVSAFQEEIEAEYPLFPEQHLSNRIEINAIGGALAPTVEMQTGPATSLQFTDEAGIWSVALSGESVAIETRSYLHFEDFSARLRRVLDALVKTVRPSRLERIGLRYINEIRVDAGEDLSSIVRSEFLGPLSVPAMGSACTQSSSFVNLTYDDASMNLQYGYLPDGTTVKPRPGEKVPAGPFFLLDFDMYREFTGKELRPLDPSMILSSVGDYHVTISNMFRWATTDQYRETLGATQNVSE